MRTAERSSLSTAQAVVGVLGPSPLEHLAADAELQVSGEVVFGADEVATALRELTCGVDGIRVDLRGRSAIATWPVAAAVGRPWIVCQLDVDGTQVRRVRAEALHFQRS